MKHYPRSTPRRRSARVPAFVPVPTRARTDGWTPERQAKFLVALARTRSVAAAARHAGMARETAYRLRRRPAAESFAAAWDRVLAGANVPKRKVTLEELAARAFGGLVRPVIHKGECVALAEKADDTALLRFVAQLGRAGSGGAGGAGRSQRKPGAFASTSVSAEANMPTPDPSRSREGRLNAALAFPSRMRGAEGVRECEQRAGVGKSAAPAPQSPPLSPSLESHPRL